MEAALTTIMDAEDSVTAVDGEDKVLVYRNWLGLMKGDLDTTFLKDGKEVRRYLRPERDYVSPAGRGDQSSRQIAAVRPQCRPFNDHSRDTGPGRPRTSRRHDGCRDDSTHRQTRFARKRQVYEFGQGLVYIVKPKMHGSAEAAFAGELFDRAEDLLGLERHTLKIGVMDEERRTSLNLKACIRSVKERVVFINTGFLDRTGDEIQTSMEAGAMIRKHEMRTSRWLQSYEGRMLPSDWPAASGNRSNRQRDVGDAGSDGGCSSRKSAIPSPALPPPGFLPRPRPCCMRSITTRWT